MHHKNRQGPSHALAVRWLPFSTYGARSASTGDHDLMKPLYIDLPSVALMVSLAEATVQREVREGRFPKPRVLSGRRVGWLMRELEEWAESRPVSDLPPPPNTGRND